MLCRCFDYIRILPFAKIFRIETFQIYDDIKNVFNARIM